MKTKYTNKLDSEELISIFNENDFVLLTETWANEFVDISFQNFQLIRLDRVDKKVGAKRSSGGIALYIRDTIYKHAKLVKCDSDDIIWLRIDGDIFSLPCYLFLCLCYIIPSGSSREAFVEMNVLDRISNFIIQIANETNDNYNLIICGDFNSRTGTDIDYVYYDNIFNIHALPDDYVIDEELFRYSQDKIINSNGRKLLEFCRLNCLRICNGRLGSDKGIGKFTYVGSTGRSVVDYVIVSSALLKCFLKFEVSEPTILSDHCAVKFGFEHGALLGKNHVKDLRSENKITKKYMWDINRKERYMATLNAEENSFLNLINTISNSSTAADIDNSVDMFLQLMYNVCDPLFAKNIWTKAGQNKTTSKPTTNKWFDNECRLMRGRFYDQLNAYRSDNSESNGTNLVKARSEFKAIIRKKRFNFEKIKTDKLRNFHSNNPKEYWRLLKENAHSNINSDITPEEFEEYFRTISDPNDPFYTADDDIIQYNQQYERGDFQVIFDELNVSITNDEICMAIKQLRNGASAGPDLLINEFFKFASESCILCIHHLFNKIFEIGYFPEKWSEGFIVPVHKKGDRNLSSNYRGITLLSVLGKLFTRVLNNRLIYWAETYGIYIEAQAGFRKHMSTIDNLFVLFNLIIHFLNKGEKLYCAFVDFTKAFDYVVRDVIWYKLLQIGVRGKMLNIIKSIYENVKSQVKHNNILSIKFTCNLGVRQGECLSPFLFSICINDLEDELRINGVNGVIIDLLQLLALLYADDVTLIATTAEDLQKALQVLETYCDRWKLTVNEAKTKVVVFRKSGRLPNNLKFTYKGSEIEIVTKFSYLGILFTSGGSCFDTQKTLAGQALKAIFTLKKYLFNFTPLKISHVLDLFDKLVAPILNYGSEVWGFYKSKSIETIHLQFCKNLLNVKQTTQNDFIYGELGRTDIQSLRYISIIKYWLKVVQCEDHKYIKRIYNVMLNDIDERPNKQNWALSVKQLLSSLGFMEVWLAQGVGSTERFISIFKCRIKDIFMQEWYARLANSTRARFYFQVANFNYQVYLDCLHIVKHRNYLTKLRVSSHRLEIEVGRWTKPNKTPLDDRKCSVCKVLEDEYHFILECRIYIDLRKKYLPKYYWARPNMMKLIELMKTENANLLKKLGAYIEKAFKLRHDILNN